MSYTTLADVKTYAGITSAADDALLTSLIARAGAVIDSATRRTFEAAADTTRVFDAVTDVDGRALLLDADLCALTSVTNGDGADVTAQVVTTPRNAPPYYALTLKASAGVAWTYTDDPEGAIAVTGKWAYSEVAPPAIQHACIRLVTWLYRQKDSHADIGQPQLTPEGALLMPSALPKDVKALLDPYRRL